MTRWMRLLRRLGLVRSVSSSGAVVVDMATSIFELDPDLTQFQTLLWTLQNQRLDGLNSVNSAIYWLEDDLMPASEVWFNCHWVEPRPYMVVALTLNVHGPLPYGTLLRTDDGRCLKVLARRGDELVVEVAL